MEPATCTSSDGADGLVSIKEELNDDGSQTVLCYNQSDKQLSSQQHFADHELEDFKDDTFIINLAPLVRSDDCGSETVVPNVVPNLYEVTNEFPCTTQTEIVHNNRLDVGSELLEVKGELDCKPEIVDNVVVPGDVNTPTYQQFNDTVNREPPTSMEIYEVDATERTTLGELIILVYTM